MKATQRASGALYRVYTLEEFLAGADTRAGWTPIAGARSPGCGLHRLAAAAALGGAVGAVGSVLALAAPQAHPVAPATIAPAFIRPRPIARRRAIIRSPSLLRRLSPRPRRALLNPEQVTPRFNAAPARRSDLHSRPPATVVAASASAIVVSPAANTAPRASIPMPQASNAAPSASIPVRTVPAATVHALVPTGARQTPATAETPHLPRNEFGFER